MCTRQEFVKLEDKVCLPSDIQQHMRNMKQYMRTLAPEAGISGNDK